MDVLPDKPIIPLYLSLSSTLPVVVATEPLATAKSLSTASISACPTTIVAVATEQLLPFKFSQSL